MSINLNNITAYDEKTTYGEIMEFLGNEMLTVQSGKLKIDGYDASELGKVYGTPLYVMSRNNFV